MPDLADFEPEDLEALLIEFMIQIPPSQRIPLPAPAYEVIFHDIERQLLRARHLAAVQRPVESLPLFRWREDRVRAVVRKERRRQRLVGRIVVVEVPEVSEREGDQHRPVEDRCRARGPARASRTSTPGETCRRDLRSAEAVVETAISAGQIPS